jgi:hypothetical protein
VAAEGGSDGCTNGGLWWQSSRRNGRCRKRRREKLQQNRRLRARRSDVYHDLYLVHEVLLFIIDRLKGSDHRGKLFDHGAQHVTRLLCGGGHGDENRGGKGGMWATAASMLGCSGYQVVMVLDRPTIGTCLTTGNKDYFLLLAC